MIILYSSPTPNGLKITLMLEECGLQYKYVPVDLSKKEQKSPEILALNPNGKIPILIDDDLILFESGAILQYLATKTGRFLSQEPKEHWLTQQWLFWQMAQIGPNLGGYFSAKFMVRPRVPALLGRYETECARVLDVLNLRLSESPYMTNDYSIADMAILPWIKSFERVESEWISGRKNIQRWLDLCGLRPVVQRTFSK